jgi:NAD(P)-dependent dehydrogenase (short-subunit alcohol dehydrogenase family)
MASRLQNKVLLLMLGAWTGCGSAFAGALVVGWTPMLLQAETVAYTSKGRNTPFHPTPANLTKMKAVTRLVELAIRVYGRIDILFNSTAMAHFNWIEILPG